MMGLVRDSKLFFYCRISSNVETPNELIVMKHVPPTETKGHPKLCGYHRLQKMLLFSFCNTDNYVHSLIMFINATCVSAHVHTVCGLSHKSITTSFPLYASYHPQLGLLE